MDFLACTKATHEAALNLVTQVFNPNMPLKFPFLLGESNLDHQFIAFEDNKVVGIVSYVINELRLGLFNLKLASIGAVATHPDFRGKGIATQLLQLAQQKMLEEGLDVVVISGDRDLYKRFGADHISLLASFTLPKMVSDYQLIEYRDQDLHAYYDFYRQQPFLFQRSQADFKKLIEAIRTPDPWEQCTFYGITLDHKLAAYLVLAIKAGETAGTIKEFAGSAKAVVAVSAQLYHRHDLKELHLDLVHNDPYIQDLAELGLHHKHHAFDSTLKILDFNRLIDQLQPYFEYVLGDEHDALFIRYYDGLYQFRFKEAHYETSDFSEAQHILFGPYDNEDLIGTPIGKLFETLFPLPFVNTSNMNYQ